MLIKCYFPFLQEEIEFGNEQVLVKSRHRLMCLAFSSSLFIVKRGHRRREEIGGWNEGLFHHRKVRTDWRGGDAGPVEVRGQVGSLECGQGGGLCLESYHGKGFKDLA